MPDDLPGRSLWPALEGRALPVRPLYAERTLYGAEHQAVIDWPDKLILRPTGAAAELFDLSADAAEQNDLAAHQPAEVERRAELLRLTLAAAAAGGAAEAVDLDEETLDALRSLGYVR